MAIMFKDPAFDKATGYQQQYESHREQIDVTRGKFRILEELCSLTTMLEIEIKKGAK